jgi:hypothetical protein
VCCSKRGGRNKRSTKHWVSEPTERKKERVRKGLNGFGALEWKVVAGIARTSTARARCTRTHSRAVMRHDEQEFIAIVLASLS